MRRTGSSARSRPTCTDRATRTNPNPGSESSTSTNSAPPTTTTTAAESSPRDRWTFAPCATTRHTRAIFELKWAPATLAKRGDTAGVPAIAQADAGGYVSVYEVSPSNPDDDDDTAGDDTAGNTGSSSFDVAEMASVRCGGGGLGMATCVDWSPADTGGSEYFGSCRLAVVGADGGARILAWRESGDLEVVDERECAHDLEAWAVAFAHPRSSLGSNGGRVHLHRRRRRGFQGLGPPRGPRPFASRVRKLQDARRGRHVRRAVAARSPRRRHRVLRRQSPAVGLPMYSPADGSVRRRRLRRRDVAASLAPREASDGVRGDGRRRGDRRLVRARVAIDR